ncbi:MAG: glucosaminidase domain-containing protein [Prevotellaceae bacterium]|jgi:LysM repeat protein|nr:glucosaminidase domain-containing protein [Prevotellaceae bacterium]
MRGIIIVLFVCLGTNIFAQDAKNQYIDKFKNLAVAQMKKSGVPASIILGQACLESGYGKSSLATEGKNHFGIKCHNSWNGAKMYLNDDLVGECFRKYKTDEDSFADHSDFLRYNKRYASLFDLKPTDYKSWAYGLKKAGYATNPKYAESLIKVIEDNKLYLYDQNVDIQIPSPIVLEKIEFENFVIQLNRKIYTRNDVKYIIANEGDSFESIADEFKLTKRQLLKYNDLDRKAQICAGQELYIKSKKKRSDSNFPIHIAQEGDTMHRISQRYAVKLKSLYRYNQMKSGDMPEEGQEIFMRNKMKR